MSGTNLSIWGVGGWDAKVKAHDLPRSTLVEDDVFWTQVAVNHFHSAVEERQTLRDLDGGILKREGNVTVWRQWARVSFYSLTINLHKPLKEKRGNLTCNKPYLVSTSYSLYSLMSVGTGLGRLSHWPSTLDRLANTGSVQNAKQSLGTEIISLWNEKF